jgi:hypothetical protein
VRAGEPRVPKKEISINGVLSWRCSLCPRVKIEHYQLNSYPFESAMSGTDRVSSREGLVIFSYLFVEFNSHTFQTGRWNNVFTK